MVDRIGPAVVRVEPKSDRGNGRTGIGSGVLISPDGLVLTNSHVVQGAREVRLATPDGLVLEARPLGDDPDTDLAAIARKLLDAGDALAAYAAVREHNAESAEKRLDAEFHSGWIALRFLKHPATASVHFAKATQIATKPISLARGHYWQGRAAEALGAQSEAHAFYERAAGHSITYYDYRRARLGAGFPIPRRRAVGGPSHPAAHRAH